MSEEPDYFQYFDPSPTFVQNTLYKAKKQIELIPALEKIESALSKLSGHFCAIKDDIEQLEKSCEGLQFTEQTLSVLSSLSSCFLNCGTNMMNQCKMHLSAHKEVILPELERTKNDFTKVNAEYSKIIEEYGAISSKTKQNEAAILEESLKNNMCKRAQLLHDMTVRSDDTEKTVIPSIKITISHFISMLTNNITTFKEKNLTEIKSAENFVEENDHFLKETLAKANTNTSGNLVSKYAMKCWDCRNGNILTTPDFVKPSSVLWMASKKKMTKGWSRKFVTFKNGTLTIYDANSGKEEATYNLAIVNVMPMIKKKRRFCFKLQNPVISLQLEAISKFDMEEWVSIFTEHNNKMIVGNNKEPEQTNCICADCGATNAQWCSLNWCVTLCLKCCGIHRQMSTKTSKVRSLLLDKMHPFIQDMLIIMTNSAANDLLIEKKQNMEIGPRSDETSRCTYITNKYKNKIWATSKIIPDPFQSIINLDFYELFYAMNFGKANELYESLTPLHAAAAYGNPIMVAIAASCSEILDVKDDNGWTPIVYAIFYQNVEVVKFLLDFGAQPELADIDVYTLIVAIDNKELNNIFLKSQKIEFKGTNKSYVPKTTKFAPYGMENITSIEVDEETFQIAKYLSELRDV